MNKCCKSIYNIGRKVGWWLVGDAKIPCYETLLLLYE